MKRGAIFDMDGVLLDNLELHLEAFRVFGAEQGHELTPAEISGVFGRKNSDMLRVLLKRELSVEEEALFSARKEQLYRESIQENLERFVVAGLSQFLEELRIHQVRIALATSGPIENVDMALDGLSIRDKFDGIVTGSQVRHGKPHPEVFLRAAELIGIPSKDCVVFEDSFSGIEAGLRAGCRCVALATTHSREELAATGVDRIIDSFEAFSWAEL